MTRICALPTCGNSRPADASLLRKYCGTPCQRAASVAKTNRKKRLNSIRRSAALFAVTGASMVGHPVISSALADQEWREAGGNHCPIGESGRN